MAARDGGALLGGRAGGPRTSCGRTTARPGSRQLPRLARQPRPEPGALQAGAARAPGAAAPRAAPRPFRVRAAASRRAAVKVAVLTTSYPRFPGDAAGHFVGAAVERLRERGLELDVVSPLRFNHYGIAYGDGVVGNLRRHPQRVLLAPAMAASFRGAAARAARDADLVHAHWLPAGAIALSLRKPYVVQVWGTDVELARRAPWLAR